MESDEEIESGKTYTTLTNINNESVDNSLLQFETFLIDENIDSDYEENSTYSDDSNGSDEEISDTVDTLNILSNTSRTFSLLSEDWKAVNSSRNSLLTDVMKMNRNEKYMLLQLFHKIKGCLADIQNKIKPLKTLYERNQIKECHTMYLGHMGAPYFKTKKDMLCNYPNADTLDRRKRGLLTIYHIVVPSRWSQTECENLTRGVKLTYTLNKKKILLKKIETIKRSLEDEKDSKIIAESVYQIERLEGEIRNIDATRLKDYPPLSESESIDWDHISTKYLMGRHNAQECSTFWNIYLHPDINKSNWSSEENKNIQTLAEKYNKQDWDQIAAELGTNRTGFTVFLHYSSVLCVDTPRVRFTEEEDRILLQQIECKKIGFFIPWNNIAELFTNRSKLQLMNRFKYFLDNEHQHTQEFTDAEDIMILILVERFGRNYIKFTKYLPSKSYMQIKSRYDNHLRLERKKGYFTKEEDEQILYHFDNANAGIGPLTLHLNRNRNQLRQRFRILKEFFDKNPNETLETMPRRFGKKKDASRRLEFLKCIADQYKEYVDVPSIEEIREKLGKPKQSKNDYDIDSLLVNFFSNSYTIKQKPLQVSSIKIKNAAETMYNLLKEWEVNLQIPAELQRNSTLDIVDLEILGLLRDKCPSFVSRPSTTNDILPPDMNSLIGFRGLLKTTRSYKKVKLTMTNNELITVGKNTYCSNDMYVDNEKLTKNGIKLFLDRFISLFVWPALLSLEYPNVPKEIENLQKSKISRNKKDSNKSIKRKLAAGPDEQITKKKRSTSNDKKKSNQTETSQQTRFSSRLRNRKQISTEEETILEPMETSLSNEKVDEIELNKHQNMKTPDTSKVNLGGQRPQIIPFNLIKVKKCEMVKKLLQNKKPLKIYQVQSIKEQNTKTFTVTKPSDTQNDENLKSVENLKKLGASGLVALADSIKNKKCDSNIIESIQYENKPNCVSMDLNKMKNTVMNSFKNSYMRASSTNQIDLNLGDNIENQFSGARMECITADSSEDSELDTVEDKNCSFDLTENEIMRNEVEKLDQLIKMENATSLD